MLENLSDSQLYRLAKTTIIYQHLGFSNQSEKLNDILQECRRRNNNALYEEAAEDALNYIADYNLNSIPQEISQVKNINSLNKYDIAEFLKESIDAKAISHIMQLDTEASPELYIELFGIKQNSFLCKVNGNSMIDIGINNADTLIVSKEFDLIDNQIAVISINDKLFVKRIKYIDGNLWFYSENEEFLPVKASSDMEIKVLGIVKKVIHDV